MGGIDSVSVDAYPWHSELWARLHALRTAGRLPHALLFAGPAGIGKRAFARRLGRMLLCTAGPERAPCGECASCRQYDAATHPDYTVLSPPEPGKSIPVEAVRDFTTRLGLAGQGAKVALIDTAESMTNSAANSLLKTLEEPPGDAVLLLVSDRSGRLPATVRSRCQRFAFALPAHDVAQQWLAEQGIDSSQHWLARAGGAPLTALALACGEAEGDDEAAADALLTTLEQGRVPLSARGDDRAPLGPRVTALIATVEDLIRLLLMPPDTRLRHPEQRERMATLAPRLDARGLFHYLDALYRSMPAAGDSLRPDIQYQGLLADAAEIARPAERT